MGVGGAHDRRPSFEIPLPALHAATEGFWPTALVEGSVTPVSIGAIAGGCVGGNPSLSLGNGAVARARDQQDRRDAPGGPRSGTLTLTSASIERHPFSESLFKTLKYGSGFPDRFGSLFAAREFMDRFTNWYNHEHRHTGIGDAYSPADVHFGLTADKAADRRSVLTAAHEQHPQRFGTTVAPKILDLPDAVWINQPDHDDATNEQTETAAA